MARPREFDHDVALDGAIAVFREQGFEGASTTDLTRAMQIGRQSLYDTFGDKWQLYLDSLKRYLTQETDAQLAALRTGPRAIDGVEILLARARAKAGEACLSVGATCEFGRRKPDVLAIQQAAARTLRAAIVARLREAKAEGDVTEAVDAGEGADFLLATINAIRIAARGGAGAVQLQSVAEFALRALRAA
ncbi:MAG: TetR/AcrR family transcriptional regulator [Hyphomonas sp.]|nr:TetR/AcrR family transcriptional regulator [Hyphomonas sp.]